MFDGEVMSSSFQDLMRQVHRKSNVNATDANLFLFDWLSLEEFTLGKCNVKQKYRSESLQEFIKKAHLANVKCLHSELIDLDADDGIKLFNKINKDAIAGGYEGIMIKDPYAPYECKRTVNWLKQKPFIEVSLEVIDIEEGTGRNEGRLGALVCEGKDDGRVIHVNVCLLYTSDAADE